METPMEPERLSGYVVSYGRHRKNAYAAVFKSIKRYFTEPQQEWLVRYMEMHSLVYGRNGNIVPDRLFTESLVHIYTTEPTERDNWLLCLAQAAYRWRQYAICAIAPSIVYHHSSQRKLIESEVVIVAEFCLDEKLIIPVEDIHADRGRLGIFLEIYVRKRNVYAQLNYRNICKAAYMANWI
ncbi:MAG: hypothetical protein AAB769_02240 [Patescibacteria group bacterium]